MMRKCKCPGKLTHAYVCWQCGTYTVRAPDFCGHCGSDIPPKDGEGTCPHCEEKK